MTYQMTEKDLEILHKDFRENEINDGEVCFIFNPSDLEKLFGKIRESQAGDSKFMNWTTEKPILDRECILLTDGDGEFKIYRITASYNGFGRFDGWFATDFESGKDWFYTEIKADYYLIIDYPKGERK